MRSTNEQLQEIMKRSEKVKYKKNLQKRVQASAIATAACLLLMFVAAAYLPHLSAVSDDYVSQRYGSLLLAAPYMGYIVVAFLAMILGVCATLCCIYWKELNKKEHS